MRSFHIPVTLSIVIQHTAQLPPAPSFDSFLFSLLSITGISLIFAFIIPFHPALNPANLVKPTPPLNKHKQEYGKLMDRAYTPTTEHTFKVFNFAEWTGLGGQPVETPVSRYGSNSKTAPCQANLFEPWVTLTGEQCSLKTRRSHYSNFSRSSSRISW